MEIKKCPFCGGEARHYAYAPFDGYQGNLTIYRVECTKCGANIKNTNGVKAIEAWNSRFDDADYRKESDTAREILEMIDSIPTNEVNELNHLRLLKQTIAKKYGVDLGE